MRTWLRCLLRGHEWRTIIIEIGSPIVTQRCRRCARYRLHRLTPQEQVKEMT